MSVFGRTPRRAAWLRRALPAGVAVVLAAGCGTLPGPGGAATPSGAPGSSAAASPTLEVPTPSATQSPTSAATPTPTATPTRVPSPSRTAAAKPATGTAAAALAALPVKGRAPKTGYDRDRFGPAWLDTDRNGCDTRNDILAAQLSDITYRSGTNDCVVATGTLNDPYTGSTIHFVRGQSTSLAVQIDHVVALSDAWQKGAQQWPVGKRAAFANDPFNLIAVDGPTNGQKSDSDAASWLPPNRQYRCTYVARQVAVKTKYGAWVTAAERDAIARVLDTCPGEPLPRDVTGHPTVAPVQVSDAGASDGDSGGASAATPDRAASGTTSGQGKTDPDLGTCKAATAAGYGPYTRDRDPEYEFYQDRDGDGVVCE